MILQFSGPSQSHELVNLVLKCMETQNKILSKRDKMKIKLATLEGPENCKSRYNLYFYLLYYCFVIEL